MSHPGQDPSARETVTSQKNSASRETFSSRLGLLMSMIGVAVGLGNVWRFPYMAGKFGGASFVLFYVAMALLIGVPALMAEWTLGRHTRCGPVGAFERSHFPFGKWLGRFFFLIVIAATAYYTNAVGWVLFHALSGILVGSGIHVDASAILPPDDGFDVTSFVLQLVFSGMVILMSVIVLLKGLRRGIEKASKVIMPLLLVILCIIIVRGLTLPGAGAGLDWFILKFDPGALTGSVMLGALGQAIFSLSLGGTYMVVYGSYLGPEISIRRAAILTAFGDISAGLLAGIAIFPAVFALGLDPASGPGLLFQTLPRVFSEIPAGWIFSTLFFLALFGAAYLSDIAAFEVLIAGLTDRAGWSRRRAVWISAGLVFLFAIPTMINMNVFVPWDLTFGSGMQTFGALLAVLAVGWSIRKSDVIRELSQGSTAPPSPFLYFWLRFVVPGAIVAVGVWWLLTDVLHVFSSP